MLVIQLIIHTSMIILASKTCTHTVRLSASPSYSHTIENEEQNRIQNEKESTSVAPDVTRQKNSA